MLLWFVLKSKGVIVGFFFLLLNDFESNPTPSSSENLETDYPIN